jgi:hypothetical protein
MERIEAMAQEVLGSILNDGDAERPLEGAFRRIGPAEQERRATLEAETERWAALPSVPDIPAPEVGFQDGATAADVDRRLRRLGRLRAGWDAVVGHCAYAVKRSRLHAHLGFTSFRHFVEERLGLSARAVEQRAAVEERIQRSPALQEARRQQLSFEKLRLLARLPEREIAGWIQRAKALTAIALRRRIEGEEERQMRETGRFGVSMPRRLAQVLAAAMTGVRRLTGSVLTAGKCLVFLAMHFLEVWTPLSKKRRTRAQKVRMRDWHQCQVPGCSHLGSHSHHVRYRSRGGSDDDSNQIAACPFHHLVCLHLGYLRVFGEAPEGLTWILDGKEWRGPGQETC